MMLTAALFLILSSHAEEESIRDKAVRNAQRVEADVKQELRKAREGACRAVKGKDCAKDDEKVEEKADEKKP